MPYKQTDLHFPPWLQWEALFSTFVGWNVVRPWIGVLAYPEWLRYPCPHSTLLVVYYSISISFALDPWFFNLATHWTFPGSFKKILTPGSYPRDSNLIALERCLGIGMFRSSPGDPDTQPGLRSTALELRPCFCLPAKLWLLKGGCYSFSMPHSLHWSSLH